MKLLQLLPVGNIDAALIEGLAPAMTEAFRAPCEIVTRALDPVFALHIERQQYHSSEIVKRMQDWVSQDTWRILGVTAVDLYVPILTFVFGEAQMGGPCAVVSAHRLRQEFYGLPGDRDLLQQRLIKEAVHEVGHTLQLTHCDSASPPVTRASVAYTPGAAHMTSCDACER